MARSRQTEMRRAIGRFQRLCCLGIGGQALVSALFSALREFIPSSHQHFLWSDSKGDLSNYYLEGPCAHLVPLYLAEYYNRKECDVIDTLPYLMRTRWAAPAGDLWQRLLRVDRSALLRSDYYGMLIGPAGLTQRIIVKIADGHHPLGALILDRSDREPAFSPRDFALLDALHDFISHGLRNGVGEDRFSDTEDRALLIADRDGRILHRSVDGQRLLAMALVPQWTPQTAHRMQQERPPELAHLCHTLSAAFSDRLPAVPPVLRQKNAWGEFVLRAHWLTSAPMFEPCPFVGVTIERREPRSLALLRSIEVLPLTEREKQLCLLLTRGETEQNAARVMGISEETVIAHRRNLYTKLGVPNRMGLVERLHVA